MEEACGGGVWRRRTLTPAVEVLSSTDAAEKNHPQSLMSALPLKPSDARSEAPRINTRANAGRPGKVVCEVKDFEFRNELYRCK